MRRSVMLVFALSLLGPALAQAQRTSVSGDVPIYDNQGKPDLTPDPKRFVSQMEIVDRLFNAGDCELVEGSVGGAGYRRLLRFDMVLINGGNGDLKVGSPTDPNNPYVVFPVPDNPKKSATSPCSPTFAEQCIGITFRSGST